MLNQTTIYEIGKKYKTKSNFIKCIQISKEKSNHLVDIFQQFNIKKHNSQTRQTNENEEETSKNGNPREIYKLHKTENENHKISTNRNKKKCHSSRATQ